MAATDRLPVPGISFVKEEPVTIRDGDKVSAGMTAPSDANGWWLTNLWVGDDEGVISALAAAPAAGPPPGAPLHALGPRVAGALSGLIAEEGGRQLIRLRMPPPADESRPWERPLICMVAIRWDSMRAALMTKNQLARELLRGFAAAVEAVGRPG
jgi:hypothetical protein